MGCNQSSNADRLQTVDDSVHVMLKHDKKAQQRKGEKPHGYVPRAEHPLLKPKQENEGGAGNGGGEGKAEEGGGSEPATTATATDQGNGNTEPPAETTTTE